MATPEVFATRPTREDSWRLRLDEAEAGYQNSTEWYRRLLEEQPDATPYDPRANLRSRGKRSQKPLSNIPVFHGLLPSLTVNGKVPEERSAAGSDRL
jgi:hypothetical protein